MSKIQNLLCMHTIFCVKHPLYFILDMKKGFGQIPEIFHSFELNAPFESCINCSRPLDEYTDYVIEKAMKRYVGYTASDTIFDYAMCMTCAVQLRNELSVSSRTRMDRFFRPFLQKLHVQGLSGETQNASTAISKCLVTEKPIEEISEYQIYAFCRGSKLNHSLPMYMISEEAIEKVLPLLSAETTEFLKGFFDKHFSPDPGLMEPISPKLLLV